MQYTPPTCTRPPDRKVARWYPIEVARFIGNEAATIH